MTAYDKAAIAMLHKFYTSYITISSGEITKSNALLSNTLIRSNCTQKLCDSIQAQTKSGDLDWDPFLDAQDVIYSWLQTLSINKNPNLTHGYVIRYFDTYSQKESVIYLHVAMQSGKYLIDDILTTATGKSLLF